MKQTKFNRKMIILEHYKKIHLNSDIECLYNYFIESKENKYTLKDIKVYEIENGYGGALCDPLPNILDPFDVIEEVIGCKPVTGYLYELWEEFIAYLNLKEFGENETEI